MQWTTNATNHTGLAGCHNLVGSYNVVLAFHVSIQAGVDKVLAFDGLNDFVSTASAPRFMLIEASPTAYTIEVCKLYFSRFITNFLQMWVKLTQRNTAKSGLVNKMTPDETQGFKLNVENETVKYYVATKSGGPVIAMNHRKVFILLNSPSYFNECSG
jgi:hypothetical protein